MIDPMIGRKTQNPVTPEIGYFWPFLAKM